MTSPFGVNLHISAGNDFSQEFYLANPDKTYMDITGCKFSGHISKHPGAIDATLTEYAGKTGSEVNNVFYKYLPMDIHVSSGVKGSYVINVGGDCTLHMQEGKYFYSVSMTDVNGVKTEVLRGLCFIDIGSIS